MMVTATASTSDPNGSPTLAATTSAWLTAASTAPPITIATRTAAIGPISSPQVIASVTRASSGTNVAQEVQGTRFTINRQSHRVH